MHVPRDIVITNVCGSRENMILERDASRLAKHITLGHRRNDFFIKIMKNLDLFIAIGKMQ